MSVRNNIRTIKNKITSRDQLDDEDLIQNKATDINILLNRVKLDKKKESRKKLLFSAAASAGVILFSVIIF
tara:strand:- start:295 stop:507 length:213 start_codon:yes stop_codon:yes gene_type:complete